MVNRVTLTLEQSEYSALLEMAMQELRNPSDQARFIIREEAQQRGLIDNFGTNNIKEHKGTESIDVRPESGKQ